MMLRRYQPILWLQKIIIISNAGWALHILIRIILLLPTPSEAKAKAISGRLYIHTKIIIINKPILCPIWILPEREVPGAWTFVSGLNGRQPTTNKMEDDLRRRRKNGRQAQKM